MLKRSLWIRDNAVGPVHQDVAQASDDFAGLYCGMKRYADAEPLYRRSLAIWEQLLGPDHALIATSLDNLAVILALQQRALVIRDRDDFNSLHNLALVRAALDRDKEAEALYKRMLAIVDVPGAKSAELVVALSEYADLLKKMKQPRRVRRRCR
jgi:tetratricopeptide (TPR) repeat protein